MKDLLKQLKPFVKESILGPLFKLLEATFELFVPLVVAAIIDGGIGTGNKPYIVKMCIVMAALGLIGLVCSVTAQYFAAKAAVGSTKGLRRALFVKLQSFSYSKLDKLGVSTMITRLTSDMNQVQTGVNLTLRLLLRSPFVVFGAMIMAFTVDVKCAVIFAVVIPVLSVVVFGIMLACIPLYKKVQTRLDAVLHATRENLLGVRVIRAFGNERAETEKFKEDNSTLTLMQKFVGKISALMNPLTYVIINLAAIVLIHSGAVYVNMGKLTSGEVVALYNYMSQILVELVKLANLIISITKSVACANRISAVLALDGEETEGDTDINVNADTAVRFDNVTLRYNDLADAVLTDISFDVRRGETVGIIGSTGSGKSSLVNLIPAFYKASGGRVSVFDKDVLTLSKSALRSIVAIVPQKSVLFSGTIRENLLWGRDDATDDELKDALTKAQALDVLESKGGLDGKIEQGGKNLSGGQRQRLAIARALVKGAPILILDDSSAALDFATDARLRTALAALDDVTVFIVAQRTSAIKHADKIIVMDDGEISAIGTHDTLVNTSEIYREIFMTERKTQDENL